MYGDCNSVARQYTEFLSAVAIGIGEIGSPPSSARKWSNHSSLNTPMLTYTRFSAPSAPTESAPSLSTRGVYVVDGGTKNCASGSAGGTYSLNCLLSRFPPASVSLPHCRAIAIRGAK